MTNKQAFIIGFCVIIGLVLHAYISRIDYQLGNLNDQSLKINTKTGEVAVLEKKVVQHQLAIVTDGNLLISLT